MILPSEIRFADEKLRKSFYELEEGDPSERELFTFVDQAINNLEKNAFCGIQIPKNKIPKEYVLKYGAMNLWKYDLPNAWRLIYTIRGAKVIVVSLILEWLTHKEYERRFHY